MKQTSLVPIVGAVALCAALLAPAGATAAPRAGAADRPIAHTTKGALAGVTRDGADQFLGVPFAKPPVRRLRFAPPAERRGWSGVRDATQQGPACIQFQPTGIREEQPTSEDCLYLDVYRPAGTTPHDRLPVMVWFHGGGHTQGTGVIYGGSTMADLTDTIIVSTNYRLGAFGFLAHPSLSAQTPQGSGNYGRMDQIASLEWVQKNIAGFGGDRKNVTIYGQSAGGQAVCDLMAIPTAKGLFDKAIVQSQVCTAQRPTLASAEPSGVAFANAVGCTSPSTVVSCLRKAWPGTLVAQQDKYVGSSKSGSGLMPLSFPDAVAAGEWNKVPVITGSTYSENRLLSLALAGITPEAFDALVRRTYGARAEQVLALYPLSDYNSPFDAITQIQTDAGRACQTETVAALLNDKVPTYRYEFNDPTSPTLYGFSAGADDMSNAHSAELQYLFDFTLGEKPLTKRQEKLATQMMRYWGSFAADGNPNFKGSPRWKRYGGAERVMSLRPGGKSEMTTKLQEAHNCDFWLAPQ